MSCRIDGFEADFKATEEWLEDTGEDYYSIRIPPEGICSLPDFKATDEWLEDTGEDYYSIRIPPESICPLPNYDWFPVEVYALSLTTIGAAAHSVEGASEAGFVERYYVGVYNQPYFAQKDLRYKIQVTQPMTYRQYLPPKEYSGGSWNISVTRGTDLLSRDATHGIIYLLLHFTGHVPTVARVLSTPQRPFPFSHPVSSSPLSTTALPLGPANITHKSVCLAVLHRLYASCSASLVLFNPTAVAVPSTV
eukprot:2297246-Pyramimonas_sp.AAC.1